MIIFPAIDIKDNKCVRLIKGDFNKITSYDNSPLDQAKIYSKNGFKNVHIVDLDGALEGKSSNSKTIQQIITNLDLKIQIGGGIRTIDDVANWIKSGVDFGVSRIIYTDINKDGTKKGPNIKDTIELSSKVKIPFIISGGISSIEDIKKIKSLNNSNIEGVIVGKSIYDGDIKINELAEEI